MFCELASRIFKIFLDGTFRTIHEVRQKLFPSQYLAEQVPKQMSSYHLEVAFLRVLIRQDLIVWQLPAESIRDNDNDAFRRAAWCIRNIAVKPMEFLNAALRSSCVQGAGGTALFERHVV
jgi:hypothetical protein